MINSFKQYLVEAEQEVFITFGRANPPTIGHQKVFDKLAMMAGRNPYRIFLSQTQDNKKNPLSYSDKIKFARKMFPKHARNILINRKIKTILDALVILNKEGFNRVTVVVGSDRVNEFDVLLNKYNGQKARHGVYNFERINIKSAGERDPDADDVTGMSASKMRNAASDNDFVTFGQGLPKTTSNAEAKKLFNTVRKGLGLKEEANFKNHIELEKVSDVREAYVKGNLFELGDIITIKSSGQEGIVSWLGTNYLVVELGEGKTSRQWIEAVEKKSKVRNPEDPDIGDRPGSQPKGYYKGIKKKSTKIARAQHFAKHGKKADDDPSAYKPAPGDATAKTKPSKYTIAYKKKYGEENVKTFKDFKESAFTDRAKSNIEKEKEKDKVKHDRMLDRARIRDAQAKNRETDPNVDEGKADKSLADKAAKSGISIGTLRKVYNRGVAAWKTGHRPGTTPSQWGHGRVNSYIMKGKTYHTTDADLRGEKRKK
jgi:hypothetical protein